MKVSMDLAPAGSPRFVSSPARPNMQDFVVPTGEEDTNLVDASATEADKTAAPVSTSTPAEAPVASPESASVAATHADPSHSAAIAQPESENRVDTRQGRAYHLFRLSCGFRTASFSGNES